MCEGYDVLPVFVMEMIMLCAYVMSPGDGCNECIACSLALDFYSLMH